WKLPFKKMEFGKGQQLKAGVDIAVISTGHIGNKVAEALANHPQQQRVGHYHLAFIKPLDEELLHRIFRTYKRLITVEDGVVAGGFGSALLEFSARYQYRLPLRMLGIPDIFIEHGKVEQLHEIVQISVSSIEEAINLEI